MHAQSHNYVYMANYGTMIERTINADLQRKNSIDRRLSFVYSIPIYHV